jgi:beta-barrel assembly-enhancing protease
MSCRGKPVRIRPLTWRPLVVFLVLVISGCGSYLPPVPSIIKPLGEDEEVRISREFRREAKKHLKFITHPEVERYVDRVGLRILSAVGPQPFDYRFFVVENPQLNAFAVPGGSIYLHSGLLERTKSTAEVAGVLSHEIVHVKGRHMARMSGLDGTALLGLLGTLLVAVGPGGQAAGAIGQAIAATRQIAYTRQLEMEADTLGVRYMSAAGYDPNGSLGFLKILDQERALNPIEIPLYMMTHPLSQERVANVELVIRSLGQTPGKSDEPDPIKKIQIILRSERYESERVIEEYEKLVGQKPASAEPVHLLAFAQQLAGKLPQARENFEKARRLNPKSPGLDRDMGQLYTKLEEYRLAREALDRALAVEPREPLNYLYLGELLEIQSDLRGAVGAYLMAHNLSPLWDKPPHRLGVAYGKLNRLGDAYYYLGRSSLLQDEDEKAIADFEKAVKLLGADSPRAQEIKEELKRIKARKN